MALAAFRNLEQRVDRAVMGRLANATATIGTQKVGVVFDTPYDGAFGMQVDDANPTCTGASSDLSALQRGDPITIDGTAYTVTRAEPDGTGLTRLILGAAA